MNELVLMQNYYLHLQSLADIYNFWWNLRVYVQLDEECARFLTAPAPEVHRQIRARLVGRIRR